MSTSTNHTLTITLLPLNITIPLWNLYYKKKSPANVPPSSFSHAMEHSKNILFTNFRQLVPIIKDMGNNFKERMERTFEKLIQRLENIEPYVFSNHSYIEFFFPNANTLKSNAFEKTVKGGKPSLTGGDRLVPVFFLPILFSELSFTYQDNVFAFNELIENDKFKKREDIHQLSENLSYVNYQKSNDSEAINELKNAIQEKDEVIKKLQDALANRDNEIFSLKGKVQRLLVVINNMSKIL